MTFENSFWLRWWPVLVLAGLAPLVVYIFIVMGLVDRQARQTVEESLLRRARDGAGDVARMVEAQIAVLEGVARIEALDGRDPARARTYLERILAHRPEWLTIILTGRERQLVNLRFQAGSKLPAPVDPASLDAAWTTQRAVVSNLANDAVALRVPVVRDGETRYTLAVPLRPAAVSDVLRRQNLPPGWSAIVADGNSRIVAHSADAEPYLGRQIDSRGLATIAGDGAYTVLMPVAGTPWFFGVWAPATTVDAPYRSIRRALDFGAAAAALLTALLLALVVWRTRSAGTSRHRFMRSQVVEAESRARDKALFLASMSHELRTPLNAVIGFADMLKQQIFGPLGDKRYGDYAAAIADSGKDLLSMVNDLLDLAKAEASEMRIEPELMTLAEASRDVLKLVQGLALKAKVTLTDESPPDAVVWADRRAVKCMLLNLIANAIKFAPGGHVIVSAAVDSDGIRLRVRDDGIGMSPGEIGLALQPFKQIDSPTGRQHRGTGLGLPLVKRLAELHGGRLDIESAKARGTTVAIFLPAAPVANDSIAASANAPGEESRCPATRQQRCVLADGHAPCLAGGAPDAPASCRHASAGP